MSVLAQVNETRTMLNTIWTWKHGWIGHVLRHDELLCNIIEGRVVGKPTRGRRKLQMLEDLYENNSYEVLKRTAEDKCMGDCKERKCKNLQYSRQLKKDVISRCWNSM